MLRTVKERLFYSTSTFPQLCNTVSTQNYECFIFHTIIQLSFGTEMCQIVCQHLSSPHIYHYSTLLFLTCPQN